MAEKLIEEITVKLSPTVKRFARSRAEQLGVSESEYARNLIESDMEQARRDFRLLAEALGANGNEENHG